MDREKEIAERLKACMFGPSHLAGDPHVDHPKDIAYLLSENARLREALNVVLTRLRGIKYSQAPLIHGKICGIVKEAEANSHDPDCSYPYGPCTHRNYCPSLAPRSNP